MCSNVSGVNDIYFLYTSVSMVCLSVLLPTISESKERKKTSLKVSYYARLTYCILLQVPLNNLSAHFCRVPTGAPSSLACTCLTLIYFIFFPFWCFQAAGRTPWLRLWGCCWSPWSWQLWLQRSSSTGDVCASLVFSKLPERIENCRVSSVKTFRGATLSHSELQLKTTTPHLAQLVIFGLISHALPASLFMRWHIRCWSLPAVAVMYVFVPFSYHLCENLFTFQASSFTMSHVQRVTTLWVASSFTTSTHTHATKKDSGTLRFVCVLAVGFQRRRCDLRRCFPPGRLRPGSAPRAHRVRLRATQIVSPLRRENCGPLPHSATSAAPFK